MTTDTLPVIIVDFQGTKEDFINTPPEMNLFRNAMWDLEQLYKLQPGLNTLEAIFAIPSLDINYKVWICSTKTSSEWSYSCASIYVKNQIVKDVHNIITLFNLQLDEDNEFHYGETVVVSMKRVSEKFKIKFKF